MWVFTKYGRYMDALCIIHQITDTCWIYVLTGIPYTGYARCTCCVKLFEVAGNLPEAVLASVYFM
jgi:hypothetical protein